MGIELVEETIWSPKQFLLKNHTQTHLLRLTPSGLSHWGRSLRGNSGMQDEAEVSGIKVSRSYCPFSGPSHTEPADQCHIQEAINLATTVCPTLEMP